MSFLNEIAARLVGAGVGVIGTNIFMSSHAVIPSGDGPYLTIIESGGSGPTRTQNQSSASTQRPTAQVMVRAANSPTGRAMLKAAYDALDGIFNTTLSGTYYLSVMARQEPTDIGQDDAGRAMVAFNILAEKQAS